MEVESDQDQDDCDVMIEPAAALRGLYAMMVSWCDQFLDIDIEEGGDRSVPPLLMIHFPRESLKLFALFCWDACTIFLIIQFQVFLREHGEIIAYILKL